MTLSAEEQRAVDTIAAMCLDHTPAGPVKFDQDCGACGSRQEAAQIWLLGVIEDCAKAFAVDVPDAPAIATKRPTTDEQGPSGTSGHRHDSEAYKATGGDE